MQDRWNNSEQHYVPMCSFDETLINGVDLSVQAVIGFDQDFASKPMKYSAEGTLLYSCGPHLVMYDTLTSKFMCQARLDPTSQVSFLKILNDEVEEGWSMIGECWDSKPPQVLVQREGDILCLFHRHLLAGDKLLNASFSADKRLLYTLAQSKLSLWNVSMQKLISYVDLNPDISRIEADSVDSLACILGGKDYLKIWKVYPERKAIEEEPVVLYEHEVDVVDMAYVPGNDSTFLVLNHYKEIITFYNWEVFKVINLRDPPTCFHCTFRECVVGAGLSLELFLIDKERDLKYVRSIKVPTEGELNSVALSFHEDQAVVLAKENESLVPFLTDLSEGTTKPAFGTRTHYGGIVFMSASRAKDLLITIGADLRIKIWNIFENWSCVAEEELTEMPNALGFHPSGFQFAIGFESACKVYYLLYDSFSIALNHPKKCSVLTYSNTGKYLAFTQNNAVAIYCPYKLQQYYSFSLQNCPMSLVWNEMVITLTTTIGSIHVFEVDEENACVTSIVLTHYADSAVQAYYDKRLGLLAYVCKDKRFRVYGDSGFKPIYESKETGFLNMQISRELDVVFLGMEEGTLRVMLWPIVDKRSEDGGSGQEAEWMEWKVHKGPIRAIEITGGLMNIFTGSDDSSIVCLKPKLIKNGKERPLVSKHDTTQLNGLSLVPSSFLELQTEELTQLQDSIKNLESDHFKLDKVQKEYEETIAQEHQAFENAKAAIVAEKEELSKKIVTMTTQWTEQKDIIEKGQTARLVHQNDRFNRILNEEFEKYETLKQQVIQTREKYAKQRDEILETHAEVVESVEKDYKERLEQAMNAHKSLEEEFEETKRAYSIMIDQTSSEVQASLADRLQKKTSEVDKQKLKAKYFLRKQTQLSRDCSNIAQEIQEINEKSQTMKEQNDALVQETSGIKEKLAELEREMVKKEETIKKKESTIKELRSLHSHLQNFRFVLDQKIKSLKDERGPMEQQSEVLQQHIKQLFGELLEEHNKQSSNSNALALLKDKNKEVLQTSKKLREKLLDANRKLEQLFGDLSHLFEIKDPQTLLFKLRDLYYKHVGREDIDSHERGGSLNDLFIRERQENTAKVRGETQKQVQFMQSTLNKVRSNKNILESEQDNQLLEKQEENANLIKECCDLRHEKEQLVKKKSDLEAAIKRLRFSKTRFGSSEAALKPSLPALTPFQEYHKKGQVPHSEIWKKKEKVDPRMKYIIQQIDKNRVEFNRQNQKLNHMVAKELITPSTALISTLSYGNNSIVSQK